MNINGSIPFALALGAEHLPTTKPVQQIVAATVPGKVSFDGVEVSDVQPLQMYARCADRIEAATRIDTGQRLNIQA